MQNQKNILQLKIVSILCSERESCNSGLQISPVFNGSCDPCSSVTCDKETTCHVDNWRQATCTCVAACIDVVEPVCASNGKTYRNHCTMNQVAVNNHHKIHQEMVNHKSEPPSSWKGFSLRFLLYSLFFNIIFFEQYLHMFTTAASTLLRGDCRYENQPIIITRQCPAADSASPPDIVIIYPLTIDYLSSSSDLQLSQVVCLFLPLHSFWISYVNDKTKFDKPYKSFVRSDDFQLLIFPTVKNTRFECLKDLEFYLNMKFKILFLRK